MPATPRTNNALPNLTGQQPSGPQPNTSLKPNLGNLPGGNPNRGNNNPSNNNPGNNLGNTIRDNTNLGNNPNRGNNPNLNDRVNSALPGLGDNTNRDPRGNNPGNRDLGDRGRDDRDNRNPLEQNLRDRNPLDGRNQNSPLNNLNNNLGGRNGNNFDRNDRGNRNDWNDRARDNYRNYNRFATYGRYNNWYRGPNYNNLGWYGGFLGFGLGINNGWGYGNGFGYGGGFYGNNGWGGGNLLWRSGYGSYYNPYYADSYGGYNYAQPIVVTNYVTESQPVAVPDFDQARQQFKNGRYQEALAAVDRAIQAQPNDPVLHEFRALTLFALGNYDQAAGTIHSVLAVGPGWDWATMIGLYPNVDAYTKQIRALEAFTDNNPQSASSRFYLAYLYQTSGQTDAAINQLKKVVAINPKDQGAAATLQMLESKTPGGTASASPTPEPAPQAAPANEPNLDTRALVGTWQATRDDGRFDLKLNPDQTFTWKFSQGQRADEITGTYKSEGPVLLLATKDQGVMAGKVTVNGDAGQPKEFQFQMVGGSANDAGLKFVK